MRITQIQTTPYQQNQKTFGTLQREVWQKKLFSKEKLSHRNDTSFFRDNEFWLKLTDYIGKKFQNAPKVNVYSYGCSDGSEAYSFVMSTITNLGDSAKKFFPVIAKDYDPFVINKAKKRDSYFLKDLEIANINANTRSCYNRFFQNIDYNFAFVKDELYDNVKFSVGDINKDWKNIKPNNSIIFARNFWPYLADHQSRIKLMTKLYNQLNPDSLLIIGQFDRVGTLFEIDEMLRKVGFKSTPVDFVYKK